MKPIAIFVLRASKRTTVDDYEHGCQLGTEKEREVEHRDRYASVVEAFRDIIGDRKINGKLISTIAPNIYCDPRGGGPPITVEDNQGRGIYRCHCDRMENAHGKTPTKAEIKAFVAGKIKLKLADYEILFRVGLVGLEEDRLAKILGVNNW